MGFNYVKFCLILGGGVNRQEREVTLTLKHGVEAKNYDDVCYMARNIEWGGGGSRCAWILIPMMCAPRICIQPCGIASTKKSMLVLCDIKSFLL